MSKYELTIKIAQIQRLVEEKKYRKAAAVLNTIDVSQVRSRADLHTFAEIYMKTEQFEAAKAVYLTLYKRNRTRRIINRLVFLAIRTNNMEEAESFYQEFLQINNSERDNLILRYRIDKAKGAPIGQLIQTLEQLKEEEYIEEWAYELAKLYQKAGRLAECRQECDDVQLWFGQGEIVERAKALADYLEEDGNLSFYEDKDYTEAEQKKENPDDTGSLPELDPSLLKKPKAESTAKEGLRKFAGLWKKEEESEKEESSVPLPAPQLSEDYMVHSQSGTGITKDLSKEIAAIYEAEHKNQLKEKAVSVIDEVPNIAINVVDRMAHAMQKKAEKTYIPLDVSEKGVEQTPDLAEERKETAQIPAGMKEIFDELASFRKEQTIPEDTAKWIFDTENEAEVTMIDLDNIKPEPNMPENRRVLPEDISVIDNGEVLDEKDLPTTRALHRTFENMLTLIAGEKEPKHFVLMGTGQKRILGVTKKIVRIMNRKQFLSTSQIARIHAERLNELDLLSVAGQIKGSCLLIDGASALLFPTITKLFALMDEFQGDFMVVLADEGTILDKLFQVAPVLARRFEYVIDISEYNEEEYE